MFSQEVHPFACIVLHAAEAWSEILRVCRQVTPLIEEHRDQHALVLALGGSERLLLGGESGDKDGGDASKAPTTTWSLLRDALIARLTGSGLMDDGLALGIGPTRTLAWLAAHQMVGQTMPAVVLPGGERAFLAALPVAALEGVPDAVEVAALAEMATALATAGVRTLGQLQRLSAEALSRRFGADGAQLAVLAAGGDLHPLRSRAEEPWLGARLHLEPPLTAEQLSLALAALAEKLALTLAQRELAAGKIALALESETGKRLQVARRLSHPLGTTRALLEAAERLLVDLLAPLPTGPDTSDADALDTPDVELPAASERYVTLRLRVGRLHPVMAEQWQLWAAEQQRAGVERVERLRAAIRTLAGGKHADALLQAELHEPDAVLPEERYRLTPRTSQPT